MRSVSDSTLPSLDAIADEVGDRGHSGNPRRLERLVRDWNAERQSLEETEEGRAQVVAQLRDPRPAVRLWSATAVLFWDPDTARPVLVEIRDSPMVYDLHSIRAKHTLLDFDAGRLERDGTLPGT